MRNKVFIVALSLIFVLCSSFSVFATSTLTSFYFAEPSTSDTQGYCVVRTTNDNDYVFIWSINPKTGDASSDAPCTSSMNLIIGSDGIQFIPVTTGGVNASYHITQLTTFGDMYVRASGNFESTGTGYTYSSGTISEVCYYGNVGIVDNNLGNNDRWLRVTWGTSQEVNKISDTLVDVLSELGDIYSKLSSIDSDTSAMSSYLNSIKSVLDNISSDVALLKGTVNECREQLININGLLSDCSATLRIISNTTIRIENKLDDLMNATGEESTTPLPDDSISDLEDAENDTVGDSSEVLEELSYVFQDNFGNGFSVVWNLVELFWSANEKILLILIMCLTIGVIKFVLNR